VRQLPCEDATLSLSFHEAVRPQRLLDVEIVQRVLAQTKQERLWPDAQIQHLPYEFVRQLLCL
jgi:hypothetical protein